MVAGCASTAAPGPAVEKTAETAGAEAPPLLAGLLPSDLDTQRIVRLHYDGPEGDGTLKLVVRIRTEDDFQLDASDRLGRRWWSLRFLGGEALVLWVRERVFCQYGSEIQIDELPLGPVSAAALPSLLLDRLPVGSEYRVTSTPEGEIEVRDDFGRRYRVRLEAGRLQSWSLWQDGQPYAWWTRQGSLSYLSAPRQELQLRWQQTSSTGPLRTELTALEVPDGYVAGRCGEADAFPAESR